MSLHNLSNEMEKQLKALILDTTNNNPAPKWCTIYQTSNDHTYANIILDGGQLNSIECFGYPVVGTKAILIFMEGDINKPVVLCNPMSMTKYEGNMKEFLNLLENGGFNKLKSDGKSFKKWTGGVISTKKPLIGTMCCELKSNTTVTSDLIDIENVYNKYIDEFDRVIQVSLNWKGANTTVCVLDQDNNKITLAPECVGETDLKLIPTGEWSYNQLFFIQHENIKKIKLKFTNVDKSQSSFIDAIRVYNMDSSREWYPFDKDEIGLE